MTLLTLIAGVLAFALFGLATRDHHERHLGSYILPAQQRRLRAAAWLAVAACLGLAIAAQGRVFGPILWMGALMFGAAATFLLLNLLPSRTPRRR